MPRALVLGATGHIGAHVARALCAQGHPVRALYRNDRFLHVLEDLPVERVRAEIDDPENLRQALAGCDWVFHCAGYYPSSREPKDQAVQKGIASIRRALDEFRRARIARVVFTSSAATIRAVATRPANEADAYPWPLASWRCVYSTVKIAMEQEVLRACAQGDPIVIVNPSLCIGEYDAHAFSGRLVLAFAKHRVPWITETCFNVVYTGDVGVGHVQAAKRGRVGERYLLTGANMTLKEFATCVTEAMGLPPPRWRIPYSVALAAGWAAELAAALTRREPLFTREEVRRVRTGYALDGSKAIRELGLPQTPIEEAIRRALEWFRANGYLKGPR